MNKRKNAGEPFVGLKEQFPRGSFKKAGWFIEREKFTCFSGGRHAALAGAVSRMDYCLAMSGKWRNARKR